MGDGFLQQTPDHVTSSESAEGQHVNKEQVYSWFGHLMVLNHPHVSSLTSIFLSYSCPVKTAIRGHDDWEEQLQRGLCCVHDRKSKVFLLCLSTVHPVRSSLRLIVHAAMCSLDWWQALFASLAELLFTDLVTLIKGLTQNRGGKGGNTDFLCILTRACNYHSAIIIIY